MAAACSPTVPAFPVETQAVDPFPVESPSCTTEATTAREFAAETAAETAAVVAALAGKAPAAVVGPKDHRALGTKTTTTAATAFAAVAAAFAAVAAFVAACELVGPSG